MRIFYKNGDGYKLRRSLLWDFFYCWYAFWWVEEIDVSEKYLNKICQNGIMIFCTEYSVRYFRLDIARYLEYNGSIKQGQKFLLQYDSGEIVSITKKIEISEQEAEELQKQNDGNAIYEYMIKKLGDRI